MKDLKLNFFGWIALLLVIVGALNWLLVGIFEFDLVAEIFGDMSTATRVLYTIVGISGLYLVIEAVISYVPRHETLEKHVGQH